MNKDKVENRFAAADEEARRRQVVYSEDDLKNDYPFRLSFYVKPPTETVTIEELEGFAQDRLKVLSVIETASRLNKDIKLETQKAIDKYLPLESNSSKSETLYEERRKDDVSHFMLRIPYCKSEELREWFIRQESILFKRWFEQESQEDIKGFLDSLNVFNWKILSNEEKESMLEELAMCTKPKQKMSPQEYVRSETFIEVDFEKVLHLVRRREVYLRRGKAYVPRSEQIYIVIVEYKRYLRKVLEIVYRTLPTMDEEELERVTPILLNIEKQHVDRKCNLAGNAAGTVSAQDVNALVQRHGPLCMRSLNDSLQRDKHLKHDGRLQYGLFIKGMGLSVEEALVFWRKSFSNISDHKFHKDYSYNVRYNYGLEGKRIDHSPFGCAKIINSDPRSGENHGCPFKHFSSPNLEARLLKDNISSTDAGEILDLVHNKRYLLACTKRFEITHPQSIKRMEAFDNPNQYYNESKKLDEDDELVKEVDLIEID